MQWENRKLLAFLAMFSLLSPSVDSQRDRRHFESMLLALRKVLEYVQQRTRQMNVDATFGITMVEANLAAVLQNRTLPFLDRTYARTLVELLKLAETTRRKMMRTILPENEKLALLNQVLNNPKLWIRQIPWTSGALSAKPMPSYRLNRRAAENLIMEGRPNEEESDFCIYNIIREGLSGRCKIPQSCVSPVTAKNPARGYPLTHRLISVEVAIVVGCLDRWKAPTSALILHYCSAILRDLIDIQSTNFPGVSRDLFTEQILLCGLEGFKEFTEKHYADLILSWAHVSGCFSNSGLTNSTVRQRRMSGMTDFGCDSHATGLGAAVLGLFIREDLENSIKKGSVQLLNKPSPAPPFSRTLYSTFHLG